MSDQPPSLLICCFDVLPGHSGLSRRVTEYLKGIGEKYQAVVLSNKTPDRAHIERYHGARLLRVPVGNGDLQSQSQAFDRAVRRQLESEEYQIVHFFDPFGGYALCEAREGVEPQYRLVYDAQTFPSQELRYTHPHTDSDRKFLSKVRRQELFCLMSADAVITGSEVTRQFIVAQGVPAAQVRVLRAPVDLSLCPPTPASTSDAAPIKVLYLGTQLGYQGLPTLLRALALAVSQIDLQLTIVGPTDPDAPVSALVDELNLSAKVEFQPPVGHDALQKLVAGFDLAALPLDDNERNRSQGGPLAKLGEYLAGGLPVIASDLPVTRELLPAEAGRFFPSGDFNRLAEALIALAKDPALRLQLGKAARLAAKDVDAASIRDQLIGLYAEIAGKPRAAADAQADAPTPEVTRWAKVPVETRTLSPKSPAARPAQTVAPEPEAKPTRRPAALAAAPAGANPLLSRLRSVGAVPVVAPPVLVTADDEIEEIADDEVMADPAPARTDEASDVMDADEAQAEAIESNETPLPSRLDPWLAQLVHGYCPPDAPAFNRHTPPTNFPGRD